MPECLEVELYRQVAELAVGREVAKVTADALVRRGSTVDPRAAMRGRTITEARRIGKLLLLDTDGPTLGLRFGMTGALIVDDQVGLDELRYGPGRYEDHWIRARLDFADGGYLALHDPRRFARMVVDPDEASLGPEATTLTLAQLNLALGPVGGAATPVKARLMDQAKVAGLGNLLVDEILWRAGLDPMRSVGTLQLEDRRVLSSQIRSVLKQLGKRGGSHLGDHMEARNLSGRCPRDGAPMLRRTIGGRTTYSCAQHQT